MNKPAAFAPTDTQDLTTRWVVPFEELRMTDVDTVGGKNASLGEMIGPIGLEAV